jgi:hypothetical protein
MIGVVQKLFAEEAKAFLVGAKTAIASTAYTRKPAIQKNISNLSHNYGAKMKNED